MPSARATSPNPHLASLPAFASAMDAFSEAMPRPGDVPADIARVGDTVHAWDADARALRADYSRRSVYGRAIGLGRMICDAIRLQRAVRTHRIDEWLATAPPGDRAVLEAWRAAFFARCDALAVLVTEALVASDLAMPEDGFTVMARRNPAQLGHMLGGDESLRATASVYLATARLVLREWDFFSHFAARQLRRVGIPLSVSKARRVMRRLNAAAGHTLLTPRHIEPVLAAYAALAERGVTGEAADRIALEALEHADRASGKPWKGLTRLYDVLVYSGLHPQSPRWPALFDAAFRAPVDYTHVPGREWIVRDYQVGKLLMQIDGKIAPGERWAGFQQGRSSLATGYLRGGKDRTEFGRRYSKPLAAFLDSMVVAEGPDHQRHRKAFLPFFTQAAVLAHARFVEATVAHLLDEVAAVARRQTGSFDVRTDFAYHFPIRVICRVLDLPAEDVPSVQHWAEAAVRAMDTDAGLSFATTIAGQRASDDLRAYLEQKLSDARAGTFSGHVIGTVARDESLSENERVANLGVVIFAGFETTTGLLSKGVEALLRHPDQWAYLRDALIPARTETVELRVADVDWRWLAWAESQPDRHVDVARRAEVRAARDSSPAESARYVAVRDQEAMLDRAVEELLRWTAPGTVVPLTASKDVDIPLEAPHTIKGCPHAAGATFTVQRGETVAVSVDELNRCCPVGAGRFAPAGTGTSLDITRADNTAHLSFGLRHSCIGAFLAKENAKRALEGLVRRFPDLVLAGDPIPQEMELFSGLASLPVRSISATLTVPFSHRAPAHAERQDHLDQPLVLDPRLERR